MKPSKDIEAWNLSFAMLVELELAVLVDHALLAPA
jgi:hypothetical protein